MASIARTSTGLEGAILIHPDGTVVTGGGAPTARKPSPISRELLAATRAAMARTSPR